MKLISNAYIFLLLSVTQSINQKQLRSLGVTHHKISADIHTQLTHQNCTALCWWASIIVAESGRTIANSSQNKQKKNRTPLHDLRTQKPKMMNYVCTTRRTARFGDKLFAPPRTQFHAHEVVSTGAATDFCIHPGATNSVGHQRSLNRGVFAQMHARLAVGA